MKQKVFKSALKITTPVMFGYIALGIGFGLLVIEKGYPLWLTFATSALIYTGAGQFAAIGLFAANASVAAILFTEFILNIRHIVYGLSMINKFNGCGKWKPYLIFALSDETYTILSSTKIPDGMDKGLLFGFISLLNQFYWIFGTVLGSILGMIIKTNFSIDFGGIDFALTALFAVLLTEQILNSKDFISPAIGAVSTILFIILWKINILPQSNSILITSLTTGCITIFLLKSRTNKKNNHKEKKS